MRKTYFFLCCFAACIFAVLALLYWNDGKILLAVLNFLVSITYCLSAAFERKLSKLDKDRNSHKSESQS
jgi:Flp pilus assembly protein TadB